MDPVEEPKVILLRELYLKPSGAGWVTLTKSIRAMTLLGKSFGDLIAPTGGSTKICSQWMFVPKGHDYLVTTISTLKMICDLHGHQGGKSLRIAKDIYWHKAGLFFEQCQCKAGQKSKPCERIQELHSRSAGLKPQSNPFTNLKVGILFGRT